MENRAKYENKNHVEQNGGFNDGLGKLPPQAIDLEEAVLGAIMIEKNAFLEICTEIAPETFYKESNGKIFQACLELYAESKPIDMLTVKSKLMAKGEFEICGGLMYLAELTQKVNSSANIIFHATILKEYFAKRQFIVMGNNLLQKGYQDTTDIFDLTDFATNEVIKINDSLVKNGKTQKTTQQHLADMYALMELAGNNNGLLGIPSKFMEVQQATGGYVRGSLTIIGARPSMGKSLHMINEAVFQVQGDYHVGIFSMEMPGSSQMTRITSNLTKINSNNIRTNRLTIDQHKEIALALGRFPMNHLTIFDEPSQNLNYIKSCCQKRKMTGKLDIIFIDYLGLMDFGESNNFNKTQAVERVTRGLKIMAKELNLAVVCYSQLSRAVETRGGDKKPQLSDLRDSGAIEQDADNVFFLHRESYYTPTSDNEDKGEILIRKNREGNRADIVYNWMPHKGLMQDFTTNYVDFEDISKQNQVQQTHNFATNKALSEVGGVDSFLGQSVPF